MGGERILLNLEKVQERIRQAAQRAGRSPDEVTLVVVSKQQPVTYIETLIQAGVRDFGENRVEEASQKIQSMQAYSAVKWHMIGHVQSRKAVDVCQNFNFVHSVDRPKIANRLNRFAAEFDRQLPILLQMNISGEQSKSGWLVRDGSQWDQLALEIEAVLALSNISVAGLMTMAPYHTDPEMARPVFAKLRQLRDWLAAKFPQADWSQLSMGMSGDFEVAVEEGATMVRVGSMIFDMTD